MKAEIKYWIEGKKDKIEKSRQSRGNDTIAKRDKKVRGPI